MSTSPSSNPRSRRPILGSQVRCALVLMAMAHGAVLAQQTAGEDPTTLPKVKVNAEAEGPYRTPATGTATKTMTDLRDVPQSISVVSRELIQDQAMQSLVDVVRYSPGVGAAQGEGNRDSPIFRGNNSTSDLFVDGVRDDVEYFRDLYNVERVEVLKGPNGLIFGRGAAGGLINRVTRQANGERVRELGMQLYSEGGGRATVDFGDEVNETLSLRLTSLYEDTESYRDSVDFERIGINPTLTWSLGSNTTLKLGYEYYDYDRGADRGIPSFMGRPSNTDASTFFGDPSLSTTTATVNSFTAVLEQRIGESGLLTNRTRYADYQKFYQNVYAATARSANNTVGIEAYFQTNNRENLFNQTDFVVGFDTGSIGHTLLVGAELGRQDSFNRRDNGLFNFGGTTPVTSPASNRERVFVSFDNPRLSLPVDFAHVPTAASTNPAFNDVDTKQASIYVQDQISLTSQWQVVVGVRYDSLEVDFKNRNPPTALNPVRVVAKDDLISPRAGVIYQPLESLSLYASYSVASLPRAGNQLNGLNTTNRSFDPEEFQNREVGAKWDVTSRLTATAALYQLDRSNVIVPDPTNAALSILVDGQRVKGVELGINGQITDAWSVAGGYAYQDAEITRRQSAAIVDGARLAQTPRNTFSLWNRYDFGPKFGIGLGVIRSSDQFVATENVLTPANNVTLPAYTRVDAAVFWSVNSKWKVQANLENLLDEEYFPNAHNNNNITPGSPLAGRVSVLTNF